MKNYGTAGLFKNDIIMCKCKNGSEHKVVITEVYPDGWCDIAYVKSYGKKNVQVIYE